jgi:hypothetical protein
MTLRYQRPWSSPSSYVKVAPLLILGLVTAAGAMLIANLGQLGYDEAVYASKARSYVSDMPADWFELYRPPGLAILGSLAALTGFSDPAIRWVTLLTGVATLGFVWAVAKQLWGPTAGLFALLGALGARVLVNELPLFHNDITAAGLLLLLMWIVWDQLATRPAPTPMLLFAAPVGAAAFYVRFGSLPALFAIGLAVLLLWGPRLVAHARLVGLTALLSLLLLVPHGVMAAGLTGSPFGVIVAARDQVDVTGPLESARQYAGPLLLHLLGGTPLILAVAGIAHAVMAGVSWATRGRDGDQFRRHLWLLVTAVVTGALIVLASHAEGRYVVFPILLLVISGAGALSVGISRIARARILGDRGPTFGRVCMLMTTAVLACWAGIVGAYELRQAATGDPPRAWAAAGQAIAADGPGSCRVVATLRPLIGWYSGCRIVHMDPRTLAGLDDDQHRTYVVFTRQDRRRVSDRVIGAYRELVGDDPPMPLPAATSDGIEVYRLEP